MERESSIIITSTLIIDLIEKLEKATDTFCSPAVTLIKKRFGNNPYLMLVSCVLSLRTKDAISFAASCRLFEKASTPYDMVILSATELERLIYPVGFYRKKSKSIRELSQQLIDHFNGQVPQEMEQLLSLSGVGRKTANLVRGEAFGIPSLCVDTHVHRIANRLGLVQTKTPEETEKALSAIIPSKYWISVNKLLVMWGQNICLPISPLCSQCVIAPLCARRGVIKHR